MENKSERTFEEIFPVLCSLTEKFTSGDSTSITDERAQSLMEAVLYCMNEAVWDAEGENRDQQVPEIMGRPFGNLNAEELYRYGYDRVLLKVKKAREIYNGLLPEFNGYRNRAYMDTVLKGMPKFFLYYDPSFEPQNHILTLDYPLLVPVDEAWTGIDRIYRYLFRLSLEQQFLTLFPEDYVLKVLNQFHGGHEELVINICGLVLKNVLGHLLAGKSFGGLDSMFSRAELVEMELQILSMQRTELRQMLSSLLKAFVFKYCKGGIKLWEYLDYDLDEAAGEIMRGAKLGCLDRIFAL